MKTITPERFEIIKLSHPNAEIQIRNGVEVAVIPTYDANNDTIGEVVMKLDREGVTPKLKPGDVIQHTKNGSFMDIVDPFTKFLKIRKGPKAD
ncbi:hypothetical protein [Hyphomicrobium sp. ghe19]|uniref:hypothetical protein n=1 Tax=Hyphomicrobium sp. ghe19 TaxID=2682968 RepID=UPI0013676E2F|nr:hypothetical protein HYPP_01518 [Hyphomicrobium sp. ghe19]